MRTRPRPELWLAFVLAAAGAVAILVLRADREVPARHGNECLAQAGAQPPVLRRPQESGYPQPLDVAEASDDVPAEQPCVDDAVVSDRVVEHLPVHVAALRPEGVGSAPATSLHARYSVAMRR